MFTVKLPPEVPAWQSSGCENCTDLKRQFDEAKDELRLSKELYNKQLRIIRISRDSEREHNDDLTRQLAELKGRNTAFRQDYKTACDTISDLIYQLAEAREEIADKEKTVELHRKRADAYRNEALGAKFDRFAKVIEESIANGKYSQDNRVKILEAEIARLRDRLFNRGEMFNPPCFSCGYNGEGYFNPKFHPCAEKHHKLAKALEVPK